MVNELPLIKRISTYAIQDEYRIARGDCECNVIVVDKSYEFVDENVEKSLIKVTECAKADDFSW